MEVRGGSLGKHKRWEHSPMSTISCSMCLPERTISIFSCECSGRWWWVSRRATRAAAKLRVSCEGVGTTLTKWRDVELGKLELCCACEKATQRCSKTTRGEQYLLLSDLLRRGHGRKVKLDRLRKGGRRIVWRESANDTPRRS
jgi:hypothetical protein